ncbi:protoporphyrinogen oxidase HemJ [Alteromonas aestuariivivens]|uniref:Protoporphyrinogen IX oxidase n=1 Tax=Alteromonas aestuariivivens TaxID=1938339 RepID=A0A3D8MEC5_9ALTE|nr:protoporphyrinogen oxidase HemJ [Alteromonas aestuariivivens]RDV28966.1 protoporphyrinogen oxidase HemJ [Alteromonas aestuariivivens]
MSILWLKALHIFFMVAWMAGIFYLPRLFVYHAMSDNQEVKDQFKIMERRLWFFVTPFAFLTLIFGVALIWTYGLSWFKLSHWLHIKFIFLLAIYIYHFYLFKLMKQFANDDNRHSSRFYRFLNEAPVLVLLAIVVLAVVKPL